MRQLMKSYLTKLAGVIDVFPTAMTNADDVRLLLKALRPLSTAKELIRLGPDGDGGYLVPNDLAEITACFSPGVSSISGFEKDCAELGMDVFLADKSVDRPADEHARFHFQKRNVGVTTNHDFMTMDHWVASSVADKNSDLMLQIDIEGHEYEVFLGATDALMHRFRIIVAEFHALDQLWSRPFFKLAARAFEKVLQTHSCVHIHPNNCCGSLLKKDIEIPRVMEFTFLRKDRMYNYSYREVSPDPLDFDNTAKSTLVLPSCWRVAD